MFQALPDRPENAPQSVSSNNLQLISDQSVSSFGRLYNEKTFWDAWYADIKTAKRNVLIVCPFVSIRYTLPVVEQLLSEADDKVDFLIVSRPEKDQNYCNRSVLPMLRERGIVTAPREGIHQKICIIDNAIAWEGSLNMLSYKNSLDHMRRIECPDAVQQIMRTNSLAVRSCD